MSKPFKLTRAKYYSPKRPHISNSQVTDYLKSPAFYKKKYIDKTLKRVLTPAMKVGQCVDSLLSGTKIPFHVQVTKKENEKEYAYQKLLGEDKLISAKHLKIAGDLALAINDSSLIADDAKFQVVVESKVGDTPVCGMIDVLTETDTCIYLDDVKCSSPHYVKTPVHWLRHAEEMGYLRQLAVYKWMLGRADKPVVCRHIVAVRHEEGLIKVYPFIIDDSLLEDPLAEFCATVSLIAEGKFDEPPVSWLNADKLAIADGPLPWSDYDDSDPLELDSVVEPAAEPQSAN